MGGGGLLQLVAYGAQDIYLTGNPQITFFKVVYRRHTNFAIESIQNTFNGTAGFGKRVVCQISRNGDLIHRIYLQVDLPALSYASPAQQWTNYPGLRLLKAVELEIGGQRIDKHYSQWMYIWNELSLQHSKRYGYQVMTGQNLASNVTAASGMGLANTLINTLYVPLEFWFCRNVGLALPLIALQYHEVKINIDFEAANNMLLAGNALSASQDIANSSIWVDYIFLDTDERRRYAQLSHEYLIEQLQFTGDETVSSSVNNIRLNFNHPVKELIWVVQQNDMTSAAADDWTNFSQTSAAISATANEFYNEYNAPTATGFTNPVLSAQIKLNGQDRFYTRAGTYFNAVQPFQHHTRVSRNPGINVYSFALKPEEHQPSGTLNMSRIDTAVLALTLDTGVSNGSITSNNPGVVKIFAVNYNVLRIMSGMGGLAYSN